MPRYIYTSEGNLLVDNTGKIMIDPVSLTSGLVAYWNLDETSGTVLDSLGINNGINNGALPSQTTKIIGTSYLFNGAGQNIDCSDNVSLRLTTKGAISCWYRPTNVTSYHVIISKGDTDHDLNGYMIYSSSGSLIVELDNAILSYYAQINSAFTLNNWTHIVFTWDSSNLDVYVNNVATNKTDNSVIPTSNGKHFTIGNDTVESGIGALGYIDEIGVWNRRLTSTEASILYNNGNGITYPFT